MSALAAFIAGLCAPVLAYVAWHSPVARRDRSRWRDAMARAGYPGL